MLWGVDRDSYIRMNALVSGFMVLMNEAGSMLIKFSCFSFIHSFSSLKLPFKFNFDIFSVVDGARESEEVV